MLVVRRASATLSVDPAGPEPVRPRHTEVATRPGRRTHRDVLSAVSEDADADGLPHAVLVPRILPVQPAAVSNGCLAHMERRYCPRHTARRGTRLRWNQPWSCLLYTSPSPRD